MAFHCKMQAVLGLLPLLAACAPASETARGDALAGRDCFDVNMVSGYEAIDGDTIKLRAGVVDFYEVDLRGGQCNTVDWTQALAIESTPSSWICTGKDPAQGNIYFREPTTRRRIACSIEDVRRVAKDVRGR